MTGTAADAAELVAAFDGFEERVEAAVADAGAIVSKGLNASCENVGVRSFSITPCAVD